MWFILALLSSIFAALTSILAKMGIENVNSNLATAIRTGVVVGMAGGMEFIPSAQSGITDIIWEPWHFRYVGRECAEYIMAHHLCLEEFLEMAGLLPEAAE